MLACTGRECDAPVERPPLSHPSSHPHREHSISETPKQDKEQIAEIDKHVRNLQKDLGLYARKLEAVESDLQKLEKADDVKVLSQQLEAVRDLQRKQMQETVYRFEERLQTLERASASAAEKFPKSATSDQPLELAPMSLVLALQDRLSKLEQAEEHLAAAVEAHDQELGGLSVEEARPRVDAAAHLQNVHMLNLQHEERHEEHKQRYDVILEELAGFRKWRANLEQQMDLIVKNQNLLEEEPHHTKQPTTEEQKQLEVQQGVEYDGDDAKRERVARGESQATLESSALLSSLRCDCSLQESMWDCCALVGFHSEGILDSFLIALGVAFNLCLQMLFSLIIWSNFTDSAIDQDTVNAAKRWRAVIGHDIQFADPLTQTSLVSQICGQNTGLHLSAAQFQMTDDLDKYQNPTIQSLSTLDGWLLCNLALILFWWAVLCDLRSNLHLAWAVLSQPRQAHPRIIMERDGQYRVNGFSWFQVFLITFFSILPRLAVEVVLLTAGSAFLVYTENMRDLVLNAVALTFILDVDDTSFSVLAPPSIKGVLERLEPIPVEGHVAHWIMSARLGVMIGLIVPLVGLLSINFGLLLPFRENVRDTLKWLCDGDVDFVYTINKASGAVYWTASQPFDPDTEPTYAERAIVNLTEVDDGFTKSSAEAVQRFEWTAIMTMSTSDVGFASKELQCMDHLDRDQVERYYKQITLYRTMLQLMREVTDNSSLASCQDVPSELCSLHTSVRAACPVSCGCDTPWSGLIFATEGHGCPSACASKWGRTFTDGGWGFGDKDAWKDFGMDAVFIGDCAYNDECSSGRCRQCSKQELSMLRPVTPYIERCLDIPKTLLVNMSSWRNYIYGLRIIAEPLLGANQAQTMATTLLEDGCEAVDKVKTMNEYPQTSTEFPICTVGAGSVGRSARPWCPIACRCIADWPSDKRECFDACVRNDELPETEGEEAQVETEDKDNFEGLEQSAGSKYVDKDELSETDGEEAQAETEDEDNFEGLEQSAGSKYVDKDELPETEGEEAHAETEDKDNFEGLEQSAGSKYENKT